MKAMCFIIYIYRIKYIILDIYVYKMYTYLYI